MQRRTAWVFSALALTSVPQAALAIDGPRLALAVHDVQLSHGTAAPHAGSQGEALARATGIGTGSASRAEVRMSDGARLVFGPESDGVVLGFHDPAGRLRPSRETTLRRGRLQVMVPGASGASGTVPISTPSTDVRVARGADVRVEVDARQRTRVVVYRGRAWVRLGNRMVAVEPGTGVRLAPGDHDVETTTLPPAPTWTTPPTSVSLTAGAPVDLHGAFAVEGEVPTRWHIEWARDAGFNDRLVDAEVAATSATTAAPGLAPGRYFARVSAVSSRGFEGPWSPVATATIAQVNVRPATAGQPAMLEPIPQLSCGVDGAVPIELRDPVPLTVGQAHRVRCYAHGTTGTAAEVAIGADQMGGIEHEFDPGEGQGLLRILRLRLHDGSGAPISGATVQVTAPPGAHASVTPPRETYARGSYSMTLTREDVTRPVRLHFVVNGGLAFDEDVR